MQGENIIALSHAILTNTLKVFKTGRVHWEESNRTTEYPSPVHLSESTPQDPASYGKEGIEIFSLNPKTTTWC